MAKSQKDLENIKKLIASVESFGDYNIYNFGSSGGGGIRSSTPTSKYYKKDAVSLTNKTVKQILALQRSSPDSKGNATNPLGKGNIFAVGKFQLIPGTLYSVASKLKLLDSLFDEATQEALGDYLILEKRSNTGRYIKGINGGSKRDLEDAIQSLGQEFASFPIITRDKKVHGNVETGEGNKAFYGGSGPNPDKSKYTIKDVAKKLYEARLLYSENPPSYIPSYIDTKQPLGSTTSTTSTSSSDKTTVKGKVTNEAGVPVAGVVVKVTPIIIDSPTVTFNATTAEYEAKDKNGNILAKNTNPEKARRQATEILTIQAKLKQVTTPSISLTPPIPTTSSLSPTTTPTTTQTSEPFPVNPQGYADTPFKTSVESDDFRKWILNKYPSYGTQTGKYKIDPPPQPKYINTDALKKAWSERGTEYNITNLKFDSSKEIPDGVIEPITVITDKDGNWKLESPTTGFDPTTTTITFSKEGLELREITNVQQTGGNPDINSKTYDIPRIQMFQTPDVTSVANSKINQEILNEEKKIVEQEGNSQLSFQEKFANATNNKKEELKKILIPFIIKLLAPFGAIALQAVISKIPLDQLKNQVQCPSSNKIAEIIRKRNRLAKQINAAYKTVTTTSKILTGTSSTITILQTGIAVIEALPYPATGVPPLGLPPLTSGVIETTGSGKDKLKEALKKAQIVISVSTLALASFGAILGIILRLLNNLDVLIQQCAQEQEVPFETINDELNIFVNQSTGISNSTVIQTTQEDNTYRGFTLEIKLDETNSIKYPRRFAQALNKQKIPVLKTDSSFASDAQVLIDQLKFIIDSNPQLTAE